MAPGTEVVIRDPVTGEIASDGGSITGQIGARQTSDTAQNAAIATKATPPMSTVRTLFRTHAWTASMAPAAVWKVGHPAWAPRSRPAKDAEQDKRISELTEEMSEGLAMVGALNIPHVEKKFAASMSGGFYDSSTAIGAGAALRFDETWQVGGSVAVNRGRRGRINEWDRHPRLDRSRHPRRPVNLGLGNSTVQVFAPYPRVIVRATPNRQITSHEDLSWKILSRRADYYDRD